MTSTAANPTTTVAAAAKAAITTHHGTWRAASGDRPAASAVGSGGLAVRGTARLSGVQLNDSPGGVLAGGAGGGAISALGRIHGRSVCVSSAADAKR